MIDALGVTDPGPVRKINEDCVFCDPKLGLLIVADGLGGHAAGEVASSLAVETISGFIRRTEDDGEFSWPYGLDSALSFAGNLLRTAVHLANRRVFRAAERNDEYTGMGTTVVAALVSGARLAVANAGDSRLYI
ncbi:MAG: protein phosphatase 2C domain-containing protein, partial [Vicinamibacterales bacterium]